MTGVQTCALPISSIENNIAYEKIRSEYHEMKKQTEDLIVLSSKDTLTGVANRHAMDEYFELELAKAITEHKGIGVILVDIDYFKEYNDTYGHMMGDQCIKTVAQVIGEATEDLGMVCRCGGDEFCIIFLEENIDRMHEIAERIQTLMEEEAIPHQTSRLVDYITVTQGGYAYVPKIGATVEDLINEADIRLYQVKKRCRGRHHIEMCTKKLQY